MGAGSRALHPARTANGFSSAVRARIIHVHSQNNTTATVVSFAEWRLMRVPSAALCTNGSETTMQLHIRVGNLHIIARYNINVPDIILDGFFLYLFKNLVAHLKANQLRFYCMTISMKQSVYFRTSILRIPVGGIVHFRG